MEKILHEDLTGKIIDALCAVFNTLGNGFLEKVYENAFVIELRKRGLLVDQQKTIRRRSTTDSTDQTDAHGLESACIGAFSV